MTGIEWIFVRVFVHLPAQGCELSSQSVVEGRLGWSSLGLAEAIRTDNTLFLDGVNEIEYGTLGMSLLLIEDEVGGLKLPQKYGQGVRRLRVFFLVGLLLMPRPYCFDVLKMILTNILRPTRGITNILLIILGCWVKKSLS
ncbi:hypothetical protein Salat_0067800 [Sesamum alatum]|uniref:Uncharacterized protein n=1 Tax=Sesamum alatum TaxID=300844 RepID=A0AAE1YVR4_9LAMI|nr:hypothetical protein Salat_0067800 [Sesamum alatum]